MNIIFWCWRGALWSIPQYQPPLSIVILMTEGLCSLPFPIFDVRCPFMCACRRHDGLASGLEKLWACWFSAAWLVCSSSSLSRALAGCLQCSEFLSPLETLLLLQAARETEAFIPRKSRYFFALFLKQLSVSYDHILPCRHLFPAENIFSLSSLGLSVCFYCAVVCQASLRICGCFPVICFLTHVWHPANSTKATNMFFPKTTLITKNCLY